MVSHRSSVSGPDRGLSLVELLVAISLIGIVGVALMTSLRTSVVASRQARDSAQAQEWLQSATEVLVNDVDWNDCDPTDSAGSAESLRSTYQSELRSLSTIIPAAWSADRLDIPVAVEFAGASGAYGPTCLATEDRQKITIQVTNTAGDIIETVQVVKVP